MRQILLGRTTGLIALSLSFWLAAAPGVRAEEARPWSLDGVAELGMLAPLAHSIQFGKQGTEIDYVDEGAQDNLYFVSRFALELGIRERHKVIFLYQPLSLQTRETAAEDIRVDDTVFKAGTPMVFTYGFPFYRASYLYDLASASNLDLEIGASMQIRNATIDFASADGTQLVSKRNIGPVPELKFRATYRFDAGPWVGTEIDGMYAPVSYLNGDNNGVVGAILDASIRAGIPLSDRLDAWLNVRYLGGGAEGTSDNEKSGDGFTANWLHFLTATAGFTLGIF